MLLRGRVHKLGNNVDTDQIIATEYCNSENPEELSRYCLLAAEPEFHKKVKKGDMIFAGKNFGCGSSREHAPLALKGSGISLVVAESFARIFFRNCINVGLPIMICPEAVKTATDQDYVEADLSKGELIIGGEKVMAQKFPPFMQDLVKAGGLLDYISSK